MTEAQKHPWKVEARNFVRAFSGAYLFGVPLLFTMELWWLGTFVETWKMIAMVAIALFANFGLAQFAGFKEGKSIGKSLDQAIDATAVGIIASLIVLLVLNRLQPDDPLGSTLGQIVVQAAPLSLGASVANILFADRAGRQVDEGDDKKPSAVRATLNDLGATIAGGLFIGFSIAPTDEVRMLTTGMDTTHEIVLIVVTLVITYALVFASEFDPQHRGGQNRGAFHNPLTETAVAYFVSLLVALGALYLFGRLDSGDPLHYIITQTLVLGLPTAVGGAAGRIAL